MSNVAVKNSVALLAVVAVVAGAAWFKSHRPEPLSDAAYTEPRPVESDQAHPKRGSGDLAAEPNESADTTHVEPNVVPPVPNENTVAKTETENDVVIEGPIEAPPRIVPEPNAMAEASTTVATGAKLPRLVDLGSDKCKDCKALAPILEALREEYEGRLSVEFIDVWKQPNAAKSYKIRLIPTQVLYDEGGHEVWRHEGFISKKELKKLFADKVGVK